MRHYFLGLAAGMGAGEIFRHTLAIGTGADRSRLRAFLAEKYGGRAILTKNGRTGLAIALRALLRPGDGVLVNGFTCYAVYEALEAAGMRPVWADISARDLNFTVETLRAALRREAAARKVTGGEDSGVKAIVVQNTLGNPVDMRAIERFAKRNGLLIIEDLAHSAGVRYADGREAGTVGAATVLSFGKDKAIDTTSGGAVVLRGAVRNGKDGGRPRGLGWMLKPEEPQEKPKASDVLRARFYPLFGALTRGLSYVHLNGVLMRGLLKLRWVEKSADNRLDFRTRIANFEAKLALRQLKRLPAQGREPLRKFCLVRHREEVLQKLREKGYYLDGFWYERPVAPERYYDGVEFPEEECPVATEVAREIINFPTYYSPRQMAAAQEVVEAYRVEPRLSGREKLEQVTKKVAEEMRAGGELVAEKVADEIIEAVAEDVIEEMLEEDE